MIELYPSPWRNEFQNALDKVNNELYITAPFIKRAEADYVCERLLAKNSSHEPYVRVVTNMRAESVIGGSLDMAALGIFQSRLKRCELVTLPHLHAKVYIFDNTFAVIGSANLTRSGLDSNYEYGVGIRDTQFVGQIKADMDSYARLGNVVSQTQLNELLQIADELKQEFTSAQRAIASPAKQRFNEKLKIADYKFTEALVGNRTAHAIFAEAILHVLSLHGALPTKRIQPLIQQLLPDLCNDSEELIINGQEFGKAWKHQVRTSQVSLKRKGLIKLENSLWHLTTQSK